MKILRGLDGLFTKSPVPAHGTHVNLCAADGAPLKRQAKIQRVADSKCRWIPFGDELEWMPGCNTERTTAAAADLNKSLRVLGIAASHAVAAAEKAFSVETLGRLWRAFKTQIAPKIIRGLTRRSRVQAR